MIFGKLKSISCTILFIVTFFTSLPLLAQEKKSDDFSESEMATIKQLALEALLENPEILREASRIFHRKETPTLNTQFL